MGANRWRDEQEWPLARTRYTPFYLTGGGHANTRRGDGGLKWTPPRTPKIDHFTYDPHNPVPTRGGAVCCDPTVFPWGPMDQRSVENREDVLVYTGAPLKQELEVTGPVRLVLYASTSALDTDFTAKLIDVFPNGEARNLTDGILRVRYRGGLDKPEAAKPGEIYALNIDVGVTSNVFLAGHSVRVEISSSNFPRFDRNPNTGRAIADETALKPARQNVYHGAAYASHILLPVIPSSESSAQAQTRIKTTMAAARPLTSASATRYGARGSSNAPAR
jgi:putative CocE/NonD family hydrolase